MTHYTKHAERKISKKLVIAVIKKKNKKTRNSHENEYININSLYIQNVCNEIREELLLCASYIAFCFMMFIRDSHQIRIRFNPIIDACRFTQNRTYSIINRLVL